MVNTVKASAVAVDIAALKANEAKDKAAALKAANDKIAQEKSAAKLDTGAKAVPTLKELDARAFMQRQQIGAALYDRSLTFEEGARVMKRQEAISAYAAKIQAKAGGPTEKDLARLERRLERAEAQIGRLTTNGKGADLNSVKAISGDDLDIVQENLMNRINAGIKDGSLTADEAKGLLARQEELNKLETAFRDSDGKLTAGEQKQVLDQLRKEADAINRLRRNSVGNSVANTNYGDQIDRRQASLEKQLEAGIKTGTLTQDEANAVRSAFDKAAAFETELRADGKVDWRDAVKMGSALNDAEIVLYDLQRNNAGKKLADSFVDQKHVDLRQAQQLESLARGVTNRTLTNEETTTLLKSQQSIADLETKLSEGGFTRGEYLRLQTAMNDFALKNQELQSNRERYTGLVPPTVPTLPSIKGNSGGGATSGNGVGGGNGNGNGGGAPVVAGPTPPAPGNPGSGNGNGVGGGNGNGNGGDAPVVAGPTPPAPGNPGSGNGNGVGGGNGNGNGGGAPVVAGPTPPAPGNPGSGNGNGVGGGNGTPAVTDPTPPVASGGPAAGNGVGTPPAAEPVPPAAQPPQAGKPESPKGGKPAVESASPKELSEAVQSPAEWDRPVGQFQTEAIVDRFAEFMGKAMQGVSDRARDIFEDLDSRRDQLNEFRERSEARKYFPYSDVMPGKRLGQNVDRNEVMDKGDAPSARPDVKPDPAKGLMNKVA